MNPEHDTDLASLYGVHRRELLRFLVARTGDAAEAEDIAQELWLRLQASHAGPIANGRSYLFRMAQNLVIDRVRETQRRMRRDRAWNDARTDHRGDAGEQIDPARTADEEIATREECAVLASAIANLPDGARRVFELHKLEGLSHTEVAARLAISRSGVEKHMAVAMKYLRRALADWGAA